MKAEELRIGNLIYEIDHDNGEYGKKRTISISASGIANLCHDGSTDRNCVNEPIPLTEEWLIKFGFFTGMSGRLYMHESTVFFDIQNTSCLDGGFVFKAIRSPSSYLISNEIKYVHQLQNLYFALINEELKIK